MSRRFSMEDVAILKLKKLGKDKKSGETYSNSKKYISILRLIHFLKLDSYKAFLEFTFKILSLHKLS